MKFYDLSLAQMIDIAKIVTGNECDVNFAPVYSVEEPEFPAKPYVNLTWKNDDGYGNDSYMSVSVYENFDVIITVEPLEEYGAEMAPRNILEYVAYINTLSH